MIYPISSITPLLRQLQINPFPFFFFTVKTEGNCLDEKPAKLTSCSVSPLDFPSPDDFFDA